MRTKILALIGIIVAALSAWRLLSIPTEATADAVSTPQPVQEPPRTAVKMAAVWQEKIDESLTAVGTLLADESVVLRPEIAGRIEVIHFTEGAKVKAGEILFQLNTDENRAMLAQTEAQQSLDQQNFDRVKEMREKNLASAQQFDEVLAKLKVSTASVQKERVRLDKMAIRAPFDGVIGLRQVAVGDYVTEGQNLVNLEALNPVKLDFKVPEKYAGSVKVGLALTATVDAFPERHFRGVVYAVDPRLDEVTRTLRVRARLPNPGLSLRPGMFAKLRLGLQGIRDALFIPEQALSLKGSSAFVYRVVDGKAVLTAVTTGIRRQGNIEIAAGLSTHDSVVTEGQTRLRDGASVTLSEAEP